MIGSAASKVTWVGRARTLAFWFLALLVAASVGVLVGTKPAHADVFRVNLLDDVGDAVLGDHRCTTEAVPVGTRGNCTLRAAVEEANANDASDTITFSSGLSGTIILTLGQLAITDDVTGPDLSIEGPEGSGLTVSGNNNSEVFAIVGSEATIDRITITGGSSAGPGAGINNSLGTLTLTNSTVSGNTEGATGFGASDLLNRNPLLGPLQNNGGPTDTRALQPGSPAIDAAANDRCLFTDQRGVARKDGDGNGTVVCDIGAYERSDFASPRVTSTAPAAGAARVRRSANLSATFSEKMTRSTLNTSTFELFRVNPNGSTTQVTNATVGSATDGLKATLNPFGTSPTLLGANTTYRAVVTMGARDLAGNQLDQSPTIAGKQQKAWTFKTGST